MKTCVRCGHVGPLENFHRNRSTRDGRHSWCRECCNSRQRVSKDRHYKPESKRRWALKTRYGITPEVVAGLRVSQGGCCGICSKPSARLLVDHDHATGKVRGLLCDRCNVAIGGWDDQQFRQAALAWLERGK